MGQFHVTDIIFRGQIFGNKALACLSNNAFFLNCNVRSIQANIHNLINMLSELYFPLSIIGLTETKLKIDQEEILNINIPGYIFLSQPSLSNAGRVGAFVSCCEDLL